MACSASIAAETEDSYCPSFGSVACSDSSGNAVAVGSCHFVAEDTLELEKRNLFENQFGSENLSKITWSLDRRLLLRRLEMLL